MANERGGLSKREYAAQQGGVDVDYTKSASEQVQAPSGVQTGVYSGDNVLSAVSNPVSRPDYSAVDNINSSLAKSLEALNEYDLKQEEAQAKNKNRAGVDLVPMGKRASRLASDYSMGRTGLANAVDAKASALTAAKDAYSMALSQSNSDRDYAFKVSQANKATTSDGTWSVQTDPSTGEQYMFNNKTAEKKPMGAVTQDEASIPQPVLDVIHNSTDWQTGVETLKGMGATEADLATGGALDMEFNKKYNPENYQRMYIAQAPESTKAILNNKTQDQKQAFINMSSIDQSNTMQLLNGDVLLSDLMASRGIQGSAMRQQMLEKAKSVDPTFSENENKQRYAFKKQWNNPNGKQGVTRMAINTSMGHLAEATEAFQNLAKIDAGVLTLKGNELENWLSKNESSGEVQTFNTARDLLASELATVYKGGVPTEPEIEHMRENLDSALSVGGFSSVANITASLLGSKINATATEYKTIMGVAPEEPLVSTHAFEALYNAGIDTSSIAKDLQAQGYQIEQKYLVPQTSTSDQDEWLESTTTAGGAVSSGVNDYLSKIGY